MVGLLMEQPQIAVVKNGFKTLLKAGLMMIQPEMRTFIILKCIIGTILKTTRPKVWSNSF